MSVKRLNYNYAQINIVNIVVGVSDMCEPVPETQPLYNRMIPIREYNESLIGMRYTGRDADGYGLFEPVEDQTNEQTETVEE